MQFKQIGQIFITLLLQQKLKELFLGFFAFMDIFCQLCQADGNNFIWIKCGRIFTRKTSKLKMCDGAVQFFFIMRRGGKVMMGKMAKQEFPRELFLTQSLLVMSLIRTTSSSFGG